MFKIPKFQNFKLNDYSLYDFFNSTKQQFRVIYLTTIKEFPLNKTCSTFLFQKKKKIEILNWIENEIR